MNWLIPVEHYSHASQALMLANLYEVSNEEAVRD